MSNLKNILLRLPVLEDGMAVFELIGKSPPLDTNSSYCNLLQCSHFANTSVAAEIEGKIIGFISGYPIPNRPDTLFIWQVAVAEQARGIGLASRMISHILARSSCAGISFVETSITQNNIASWALFKSFAKTHSIELQSSAWMDKEIHFAGQHNSEALVRIGPLVSTVNQK